MLPFSASLLCLFFLLFCFNFSLRKQLPFSAVPSRCPPKKQQTTVKFMYELWITRYCCRMCLPERVDVIFVGLEILCSIFCHRKLCHRLCRISRRFISGDDIFRRDFKITVKSFETDTHNTFSRDLNGTRRSPVHEWRNRLYGTFFFSFVGPLLLCFRYIRACIFYCTLE